VLNRKLITFNSRTNHSRDVGLHLEMIQKIYKISFLIFSLESILLIIGISLGYTTYGIDISTPIMQIAMIIALIIAIAFLIVIRKTNSTSKKTLAIILSVFQVTLCFYYLLEDQFKILF